MSILSSSLTGDFIRASASTSRSRGADLAAAPDRPPFRDHLDAARNAGPSAREIAEGDAAERRGEARDAEAADAAEGVDDDHDDRTQSRRSRGDDERTGDGDAPAETDADAAAAIARLATTADDAAITLAGGAAPSGDPAAVTVAATDGTGATSLDPAAAARLGPAGDGDGAGVGDESAAFASGRPEANGPAAGDSGAVVRGGGSAAAATTAEIGPAAAGPGTTAAISGATEPTGPADPALAANTTDAGGRAGGRFELHGEAARPETTIDRSAYRSAMADRAAGRELAPAERQAMAMDERIARARIEAAARAAGTASRPAPDGGGAAGAAATVAAGPRTAGPARGHATSSAAGGGPGSGPGIAGSTTAATSSALSSSTGASATATATAAADAGVPARPGPASPAGVPADAAGSAPGRATGDDSVAHALRGVRMLVGRGGGSMTLRLQPGDLGDMRVRVDIRGGKVTADFHTTTDAARTQIERGLETLRRGLEERGLQVERLTVRGGDAEAARPGADGARTARDESAEARERGGGAAGEDRHDDAAGRQSDGRRDEPPARRPLGERASSPDALRAFASIFGERLQ